MWQQGFILGCWSYEAKVYELPSTWGINDSRISKLWLYKNMDGILAPDNESWEEAYAFDRSGSLENGYINENVTNINEVREVVNYLLQIYN